MRRFIYGCLVGGTASYFALSNYNKVVPSQGLGHEELKLVNTYLHHHKLEKLLKQSIMNGYMQLNKAFLDYGIREKIEGFYYYGTFFEQQQINTSEFNRAYCIFSPKEQLCGHPSIQHGGVTATIADQNSGTLAMLYSNELVATGQLNIKYKRPVRKGQVYAWKGEIERRQGRIIHVKSTVQQLQTGKVCAEVRAVFVTVNWQHKMGEVFRLLFKKDKDVESAK